MVNVNTFSCILKYCSIKTSSNVLKIELLDRVSRLIKYYIFKNLTIFWEYYFQGRVWNYNNMIVWVYVRVIQTAKQNLNISQ